MDSITGLRLPSVGVRAYGSAANRSAVPYLICTVGAEGYGIDKVLSLAILVDTNKKAIYRQRYEYIKQKSACQFNDKRFSI
jgi:hypothetical protein